MKDGNSYGEVLQALHECKELKDEIGRHQANDDYEHGLLAKCIHPRRQINSKFCAIVKSIHPNNHHRAGEEFSGQRHERG